MKEADFAGLNLRTSIWTRFPKERLRWFSASADAGLLMAETYTEIW